MEEMTVEEWAEACALSTDIRADEQLKAAIAWAEGNGESVDRMVTAYGEACRRLRADILASRETP